MLDINTPRGQQSLEDEYCAAMLFENSEPAYQYIMTPKKTSSRIDALLLKKQMNGSIELAFVVETKCRYDMTIDKFRNEYFMQWLVTFEKMQSVALCASLLQIPALGFLYIVQSKVLLVKKLCDSDGNFLPKIKLERTETKRSTNGGRIVRTNAYIDMRRCREYSSETIKSAIL